MSNLVCFEVNQNLMHESLQVLVYKYISQKRFDDFRQSQTDFVSGSRRFSTLSGTSHVHTEQHGGHKLHRCSIKKSGNGVST